MQRLRLMADYGCFSLWLETADGERNVRPEDVGISGELATSLYEWARRYDATLDRNYPPSSGFASVEDEVRFEDDGARLWEALKNRLGSTYRVVYFSRKDQKVKE